MLVQGIDATDYVRRIVNACDVHTPQQQERVAHERDAAARAGDFDAWRARCWELAIGSARLAMWVAHKYYPQGMEQADLISASIAALYRAAESWDPDQAAFSTYATWWCRQAVQRQLADHSRLIRVPVHAHDAWLRAEPESALVEAAARASKEPVEIGVAFSTAAAWEDFADADTPLTADEQSNRFRGPAAIAESRRTAEMLAEHATGDATAHYEGSALADIGLSVLPPRLRDIMERRCGLSKAGDGAPQTLDAIGKGYGLTSERIRQLEAEALRRMRAALGLRGHPAPSTVAEAG